MSDKDLVEAAKRGDEEAFAVLYRRHRGYVLAVAARFGVTEDGAHDVLQETFFQFIKVLPGFCLRAKFTTFLYPLVKHVCLKKKARSKRFSLFGHPHEMEGLLPPAADPGGSNAGVLEIIASLPEHQREVLILRFVDGMSLEELAEAIGIPLGTVKSRLHHALAALKKINFPK